jgi:hypothetical protein
MHVHDHGYPGHLGVWRVMWFTVSRLIAMMTLCVDHRGVIGHCLASFTPRVTREQHSCTLQAAAAVAGGRSSSPRTCEINGFRNRLVRYRVLTGSSSSSSSSSNNNHHDQLHNVLYRCYRFIDLGIYREFSHFDGQKDWMPPPPNGITVAFQPNDLGQSVLKSLPPAASLVAAAAAAAASMGLIMGSRGYVALHVRRNDM